MTRPDDETQPLSTPQPLSEADLAFLPSFVRQKALEAAEVAYATEVVYEERSGTIEEAQVSSITLQVGNLDVAPRWLHLGGSGCWIEPDYHALYFEPIPQELRPQVPDAHTWWLLYSEDDSAVLHIRKITLVSGSQALAWDL